MKTAFTELVRVRPPIVADCERRIAELAGLVS
jgi:hypothetical protein